MACTSVDHSRLETAKAGPAQDQGRSDRSWCWLAGQALSAAGVTALEAGLFAPLLQRFALIWITFFSGGHSASSFDRGSTRTAFLPF